jgi:hypothetical protein
MFPLRCSSRGILAVDDGQSTYPHEPWTVIYVPADLTESGFRVGMTLSDREVARWGNLIKGS